MFLFVQHTVIKTVCLPTHTLLEIAYSLFKSSILGFYVTHVLVVLVFGLVKGCWFGLYLELLAFPTTWLWFGLGWS